MIRTRPGVAVALVACLLVVGCSGGDDADDGLTSRVTGADEPSNDETGTDATAASDEDAADADEGPDRTEVVHVAQAVDDTLVVRDAAQEGADEIAELRVEDQLSGKIVCLVSQQVGNWVEVYLPTGPESSRGWVARDDVALSRHRFRIEVSLSEHELTLYASDVVALSAPVAIGPDAPEAGEQRFVKELIQTPDPAGPYGSYAYGLSGADNGLDEFRQGSGVVAVHGTADPNALGGDARVGAIAVGSDIVTRMVDSIGIPLGTPVTIVD